MADKLDPMRWVWRGITGATLLFGWLFILVQNNFHIDPPVVVVMLAYFAVVATITNLWRVGAAAVAPDMTDDAWERPLGERGDLEKEKRTLLRSIKETEFDQAMGKLSKPDAEQLIQMYRARAIEVIKELDRLDAGQADSPRQKIEREVAARLLVEQDAKKAGQDKKKKKPAEEVKPAEEAKLAEEPAPKAETAAADTTEASS